MKVLMFGWEFPPHISGGLGTACFGLTQAMGKLGIDVLFVVPKLHGEESHEHLQLINASQIPILQKEYVETEATTYEEKSVSTFNKHKAKALADTDVSNVSVVEVPSTLTPYRSAHFKSTTSIERWNYQIDESDKFAEAIVNSNKRTHLKIRDKKEKRPYEFSGTYGPDLFEETARYAAVASEIAKQHSFDAVHAHDWMTFDAGIAAKEISGKPLFVHVHATEFDRSGTHVDPHIFNIEQRGMQYADMIFTVSMRTKRMVVEHYNVPPEKVHVVHNGILPKSSAERPVLPKLGANVVTFLGRVTYQKGPLYFVEAARLVLMKFPDTHFIIAGSGDLLPQIIERIAELRLSERFHFTGFLKGPHVEKVWSMTDVYVMPSVSEPFGIAPLEAIQGGVPVVVSKQSGVAEVMPHAIKVDFWDISALANSIGSILKYKSLSNTLKKYSKEEIAIISWENVAKKINKYYHELSN
jgi:glycogen(starch) synthase